MENIASDFTSLLRTYNESFDQNVLEFRSLESNSIKSECRRRSSHAKDKSYSEEVKAFIQRVLERRKTSAKGNNFTQINSSTPFKLCGNNEIDISGIAFLDANNQRKLTSPLNDSDFESMDQDQYDDDDESKENIEMENKVNESRVKSIKNAFLASTPKASTKKTKNSRISPHKMSRKWKKLTKMRLTRENLRKYLTTDENDEKLSESFVCQPPSELDDDENEKFSSNYIAFNTSLDYLTEQLQLAPPTTTCDVNACNELTTTTTTPNKNCEIVAANNDSLCEFTFSQPNTTKTSEASIKNLSQLSVSIQRTDNFMKLTFAKC
jgi:hypothetical protein